MRTASRPYFLLAKARHNVRMFDVLLLAMQDREQRASDDRLRRVSHGPAANRRRTP
jgi:hypothetical protein